MCAILPFRWFVILGISCVFGINYKSVLDKSTPKTAEKVGDDVEVKSETDKKDAETPPFTAPKVSPGFVLECSVGIVYMRKYVL